MMVKYPKLLIIGLTFVFAYLLFTQGLFLPIRRLILSLGLPGHFISGFFYAYSLTASTATAAFLVLAKENNLLIATFLGGIGALIADITIFKIVRYTLSDEIKKISREPSVRRLITVIPGVLKAYILPLIAAIVIASPLPDEIGITLFAATGIRARNFMLASYVLNTLGILIILLIGRQL